jgi:hypothetical protein
MAAGSGNQWHADELRARYVARGTARNCLDILPIVLVYFDPVLWFVRTQAAVCEPA